eukprot:7619-Heterococcus_DN1.PRE.1
MMYIDNARPTVLSAHHTTCSCNSVKTAAAYSVCVRHQRAAFTTVLSQCNLQQCWSLLTMNKVLTTATITTAFAVIV